MTEQHITEPGWHRDSTGAMRWWDGYAWTGFVAPTEVPTSGVPTGHGAATTRPVVAKVLPGGASGMSVRAQVRSSGGGLWRVVVGVALLGVCALTFALAQPHGGVVWTGAGLFGTILALRGLGQLVPYGSRTQQRLHGAATQLADPWGAHHAAKARQKAGMGPDKPRHTWIIVLCVGVPVVFLLLLLLSAVLTPT